MVFHFLAAFSVRRLLVFLFERQVEVIDFLYLWPQIQLYKVPRFKEKTLLNKNMAPNLFCKMVYVYRMPMSI